MTTTEEPDWQPDAETIRELSIFLRDSLDPLRPEAQKTAAKMLMDAQNSLQTPRYLAYILLHASHFKLQDLPSGDLISVRSSAAVNLKNAIRCTYSSLDQGSKKYIQSSVLSVLQDEQQLVRNLTSSVITEMVRVGSILEWPDLLPKLLSIAANDGLNLPASAQDGAMSAMSKICEDEKDNLTKHYHGQYPLHFILPRLLDLSSNKRASVRARALECINSFSSHGADIFFEDHETVLKALYARTSDQDPAVREALCHAYVLWIEIRPEQLEPYLTSLINYMCDQQRDIENPGSALEAAEFWLAASENEGLCPMLQPHLGKIVPLLLDSMVYDEENILRLGGTGHDADEEDQAKDIKPRFAKTRAAKATGSSAEKQADREPGEISDDEDDDAEDDDAGWDDTNDDPDDQWNLRKCSAATLDVLASKVQGPVFNLALQYLNVNLMHTEWPRREAAVLAMGAVAEGCLEVMAPALPNVIPYLVSLLHDQEAAVRIITCWALGRYSTWTLKLQDKAMLKQYFEPILYGILERMLDGNKKVQEAASSAFANIVEKAGPALAPYLDDCAKACVGCFGKYKTQNMYILYDCIQALAEFCGPNLAGSPALDLLLAASADRWSRLSDSSPELLPLQECLSYMVGLVSPQSFPYSPAMFERCTRIIRDNYAGSESRANDIEDRPAKDFIVTSLDLLSSIIQILDESESASLIKNTSPHFFDLLNLCMQDSSQDVRQSAYALLGDCAVYTFAELQPFIDRLLPTVIQQIDVEYANGASDREAACRVINNACWSCGEIVMRHEITMTPYLEALSQHLKLVLDSESLPISVGENAAIAFGRLGINHSSSLAPHLEHFVATFLDRILVVDPTDERRQAMIGLNKMIMLNPYAVGEKMKEYLQLAFDYRHDKIASTFREVLDGYKLNCRQELAAIMNQIPGPQKLKLAEAYAI